MVCITEGRGKERWRGDGIVYAVAEPCINRPEALREARGTCRMGHKTSGLLGITKGGHLFRVPGSRVKIKAPWELFARTEEAVKRVGMMAHT